MFCSMSLEKMHHWQLEVQVTMGMREADMNIILNAHLGARVTMSIPFGNTAIVQVMLGTQQGDCLSPSLSFFFINLCLRRI